MCPAMETDPETEVFYDPYESFMQHHLQHYGLFTGKSSGYQKSFHYIVSENSSPDSNDSDVECDHKEGQKKTPYSLVLERALLRTRQLVFDFHGGKQVPRLREPRSLFAIPTRSGPLQPVHWPIECEVIKDKIEHIEWVPPEPEEFYHLTGYERTPMCVGDDRGNAVYSIDSAMKSFYFTFSRIGGCRGPIKEAVCPKGKDDSSLVFESRFESGNLQKAVRVRGQHDYELTLRTDLYTKKHTQWYYFRVQNMKPGTTYRFTIVNLMKSNSLYNLGLKPLLYSEREAHIKKVGWKRTGSNIKYYKNQSGQGGQDLFSLTWTCQFPHENDTCYFAHCYPYTYSDLQRYLAEVSSDPLKSQYCKFRVLCRSLAGNVVYILNITSPSSPQHANAVKKAVVVTARVHPGETNSSWMMKGFLDFILGSSNDAQLLRDMFVFKVVPMLNPDGVIVGNYRCSLAGRDLNRNYKTVLRESFPCVWHTRNMVKRLVAEKEVVLYCDFHGHSRKNNVFMYGCDSKNAPSLRLHERVFPLMLSKNAADKFSFKSCKFRAQKSKEGTGRIVMWRMGIPNSYTMESTFCGSTLGGRKGTHFSTEDLKSLGYHFCDTLLDYCDPDPSKFSQCVIELREMLQEDLRLKLQRLGREIDSNASLSDISLSDIESSTSGSNSTESDGLPMHLISLCHQFKQKKKLLRTRKERNKLRQERDRLQKTVRNDNNENTTRTATETSKKVQNVTQEKPGGGNSQEKKSEKRYNHKERSSTVRAWIPHPSTGIAIIGDNSLLESNQEKYTYLESVTSAYLRSGVLPKALLQTDAEEFEWSGQHSVPMSHHHVSRQRRTLPMRSIQQHGLGLLSKEGSCPIRLHPCPFDSLLLDTLTQPDFKRGTASGASSCFLKSSTLRSSTVLQSKVVPGVPTFNRLLVFRSSHSLGTLASSQGSAQEPQMQPSSGATSCSSETIETGMRMKLKPGIADFPSMEETGNDRGPPKDAHCFLPGLKNLHREMPFKSISEEKANFSPLTNSFSLRPQNELQREKLQKLQKMTLTTAGKLPPRRGIKSKPAEAHGMGQENGVGKQGRAGKLRGPVSGDPEDLAPTNSRQSSLLETLKLKLSSVNLRDECD
ncbi:cytosolic carboxypeptidase 2-like isoform X3 [Huso huso]|uniref:Cytosolic carboxypeptidase 2 n=1 Tax=Huso huso TaxID=61971 RepID=A0ABR0YIP9_HUSHU